MLHNVPKAPPRCFRQPTGRTFQLFTDGSFEKRTGCLAGVLCRGTGRPWQFWSAQVPTSLVNRWLADGVQHPIMQCELLAAAVSLAVWGPVLSSPRLTLWIDNDAARHSIVAAQAYSNCSGMPLRHVGCQGSKRFQPGRCPEQGGDPCPCSQPQK